MKSGITYAVLLQVAVEVLVAALGGYGLRQGLNRANQAWERSAAADERKADAEERAHPAPRKLPRPSLLNSGDVISTIGPSPCMHVWKQGHEDDPRHTVCGDSRVY